ncbi:hypothetical protein GCM10010441_15710 [Kitasatospora paracochleata]
MGAVNAVNSLRCSRGDGVGDAPACDGLGWDTHGWHGLGWDGLGFRTPGGKGPPVAAARTGRRQCPDQAATAAGCPSRKRLRNSRSTGLIRRGRPSARL